MWLPPNRFLISSQNCRRKWRCEILEHVQNMLSVHGAMTLGRVFLSGRDWENPPYYQKLSISSTTLIFPRTKPLPPQIVDYEEMIPLNFIWSQKPEVVLTLFYNNLNKILNESYDIQVKVTIKLSLWDCPTELKR